MFLIEPGIEYQCSLSPSHVRIGRMPPSRLDRLRIRRAAPAHRVSVTNRRFHCLLSVLFLQIPF